MNVRYSKPKPFKAQSEEDDQTLRRFKRIAGRSRTQQV